MNGFKAWMSVCVLVAVPGPPAYGIWTWTTLGYPGATWTSPVDISGNNIVGAYTKDGGNTFHGFLYDGMTWTTLD